MEKATSYNNDMSFIGVTQLLLTCRERGDKRGSKR